MLNDSDTYFLWVAALFDRLSTEQPEIAQIEVKSWPQQGEHFFDKLRLYAWAK